VYEIVVWVLYAGLYKYSYYLKSAGLHVERDSYFPYPQVLLYAILLTLYIIPLYRFIMPRLLMAKKYGLLSAIVVAYFWVAPKLYGWLISYIFLLLNGNGPLHAYFAGQYNYNHIIATHVFGWDLDILFTDLIAFCSVAFMRYAFDTEQKKHALERDNLQLQLESLKAQLNPHFLFNTLNSIYGMSLTGNKETPQFILKLSDMMRYILYDCSHSRVTVEKDMEFLENYFEMERKRYPNADISFTVTGDAGAAVIAPLLLIPFAENSFKHGAHRLNDTGFIHAKAQLSEASLLFVIENDIFSATKQAGKYGGVGIANVKKRLELYYPSSHQLDIVQDNERYKVTLTIMLK